MSETPKIGITANCSKILTRLAGQNKNTGEALRNETRRLWDLLNYDLSTTGDPTFDAEYSLSMADAASSKVHELLNRDEASENYEQAHKDTGGKPPLEKSTYAVVTAKAQIDVLAGLEAGYRSRYMTSRIRNIAHNAARVQGHGLDEGPIAKDMTRWITRLGTPTPEKDAE